MTDIIVEHLDFLRYQRKSERTIEDRCGVLRRASRHLPCGLDDVYSSEIQAFLASNRSWANDTVRVYFTHLRGFYEWAFCEGRITANPMLGMKAPRASRHRPKPVPTPELKLALASSAEPWYTCIMLGVCAGLRASEMATIRREDIDQYEVHVRCGKGNKERFVSTSLALWQFVKDRPSGLLVRASNGSQVTGRYLSCRQQAHWRAIGLPNWHLHRLRHTFCTTMWQSRADPIVVSEFMGHESVATTQIYALPADAARRAAVRAIDDLLASVHQPGCDRLVPPTAA